MKNRGTIIFLLVLVIIWSGPKLIVSEIESQSVIYWTGIRKIMKIQLTNMGRSNGQAILTTGLEGPYDIVLDIRRDKMYWTVAGKIQSADLNGSNAKDVITGLNHPHDIALDVKAGKIYWTQGLVTHQICCADLDGTNVQNLISGLNYPRSIALNLQEGKIYWTEGSPETPKTRFTLLDSKKYWVEGTPDTAKIRCAGLDGTNVQDLVTTGLDYPDGIALDVESGKIYWTQYLMGSWGVSSLGKIRCADLDGTNVQNLVTGLGHPKDIALDVADGKMYWIDANTNKIQCSNLYGIGVQDVTTEVFGLEGIAVVRSK